MFIVFLFFYTKFLLRSCKLVKSTTVLRHVTHHQLCSRAFRFCFAQGRSHRKSPYNQQRVAKNRARPPNALSGVLSSWHPTQQSFIVFVRRATPTFMSLLYSASPPRPLYIYSTSRRYCRRFPRELRHKTPNNVLIEFGGARANASEP